MQVILEVSPKILYDEMFTKVFKNSLFELSADHCGNFVIQALISHARDQDQVCVVAFVVDVYSYALSDLQVRLTICG